MFISNLTTEIIEDGNYTAYFAIAGGGTDALADLLRTPGASGLVHGATIPYSSVEMTSFLGCRPEQACCLETAWKMANVSYQRALCSQQDKRPLGVACTAALGTNRVRKGADRAFIVLQTADAVFTFGVRFWGEERSEIMECGNLLPLCPHRLACETENLSESLLSKDSLERIVSEASLREQSDDKSSHSITRALQERLVSDVLLNALRYVEQYPDAEFQPEYSVEDEYLPEFSVTVDRQSIPDSWQGLLAGQSDDVIVGSEQIPANTPIAIFPGSFNPIHDGHRRMRAMASSILNCPVCYELSVCNADKPSISPGELLSRLDKIAQADTEAITILSHNPYFIDKARRYPGSTFIVGADTIIRINDRKYYPDEQAFNDMIAEFTRLQTHFLVFGRATQDGVFESLETLNLSDSLRALCREVPQSEFACPLSSTQIRKENRV